MLRLGDISKRHSDLLRAVELWEAARPLFKRSSQVKQVERIDERLTSVGENALEEYRENLACLKELNAPSGAVEELEDEVSNVEDTEAELDKTQDLNPVAI
jgi:uncharacterized protein Yka (UPF0111/DUF47 family)